LGKGRDEGEKRRGEEREERGEYMYAYSAFSLSLPLSPLIPS
jgi:hypothetical protein